MTWIAVLLIGVALADLTHSVRPVKHLDEIVGAAGAVAVGLAAGLTDARDVAALVVIAGIVVVWGLTVRHGFGRREAWLPLAVLGAALVVAVLLSGWAGHADGLLDRWLVSTQVPVLAGLAPDRALLLAAVLLVQMSTGNVIVRLVLTATGTVNPARHPAGQEEPEDPELRLKGGRLLGPMERLVIVGLGLAGHLTAASIVIAAKGLLRFPELQSKSEQVRIHQLTEYFLVGSFASWLVALSGLVLLGPGGL